MNKWYKSGLTKGILIVLQHVLLVVALVSLVWMAAYPGLAQDILSGGKEKSYDKSNAFSQQVYFDSQMILRGIQAADMLEKDGKLDKEKLVDIEKYSNSRTISGKNDSGFAYTLGDIEQWYDEGYDSGNYGSIMGQKDQIIVCKKPDETYEYYRYSKFKGLLATGELTFVMNNSDVTQEDLLSNLQGGYMGKGEWDSSYSAIKDAEDKVRYVSCWNYDGYWVDEKYAPQGAESIIDLANSSPKWNGRLNEAYSMIDDAIRSVGERISEYNNNLEQWQEGDTNLSYIYADLNARKVYTNRKEYQSFDKLESSIESLKKTGRYTVVKSKLADFDSDMNGAKASEWRDMVKEQGTVSTDFVYAAAVDTAFPIQDEYYDQNQLFKKYAPRIRGVIVGGALSVLLIIGIMVWLTVIAGRSSRDEELHLHPFDKWKTEIAAAIVFAAWFAITFTSVNYTGNRLYATEVVDGAASSYTYGIDMANNLPDIILISMIGVLTCAMFMVGYLSLVRRIKAGTLWKNSLLRWFIDFFRIMFGNLRATWKTILIFAGFIIFHWIALGVIRNSGLPVLLLLAVEIAAGVYLVKNAVGRQKIKEGIERIAGGEVDYKVPMDGLTREQQMIAEKINAIGEGLDAAVEASMKNERLKTDLITNVSHDIKTPLTSIINYVDILKRENFDDPKIQGYLDILEAKAQRLKTLTEDVVEASKVSSGNISLEFMNINLVEMIQQTSGEFEEKFGKRGLKEVLTLPDEEAVIRVDGRRMWRVLENIYNNAAKYAMEGTRVYADLKLTDTTVVFSLKNVSEQALNINADELTERFIRGDISRSTEGSGLGLSIAKTLTEMQKGTFDLYVDGDLFRVTITFPRMVKPETNEQ